MSTKPLHGTIDVAEFMINSPHVSRFIDYHEYIYEIKKEFAL